MKKNTSTNQFLAVATHSVVIMVLGALSLYLVLMVRIAIVAGQEQAYKQTMLDYQQKIAVLEDDILDQQIYIDKDFAVDLGYSQPEVQTFIGEDNANNFVLGL